MLMHVQLLYGSDIRGELKKEAFRSRLNGNATKSLQNFASSPSDNSLNVSCLSCCSLHGYGCIETWETQNFWPRVLQILALCTFLCALKSKKNAGLSIISFLDFFSYVFRAASRQSLSSHTILWCYMMHGKLGLDANQSLVLWRILQRFFIMSCFDCNTQWRHWL